MISEHVSEEASLLDFFRTAEAYAEKWYNLSNK